MSRDQRHHSKWAHPHWIMFGSALFFLIAGAIFLVISNLHSLPALVSAVIGVLGTCLSLFSLRPKQLTEQISEPPSDPQPRQDIVPVNDTRPEGQLSQPSGILVTLGTLPRRPPEPDNPYKGLKAFTEVDACYFCGRDKLIDEMANATKTVLSSEQKDGQQARLLAVIGPSGSGKSSVVRAGLIPRLRDSKDLNNEGFHSKKWVYLNPMFPGKHPIENLAISLAKQFPDRGPNSLLNDLWADSRALHILAKELVYLSERKVVLVVDQFEEVFSPDTSESDKERSEEERQQFFDLLITAVTEPSGPLFLVLTLRIDFYQQLVRYPILYRLIDKSHISVLPLTEKDDLRKVIEQPANLENVQLTFEGDLVNVMLFDMQRQSGALPLLEFMLDQLYRRRDRPDSFLLTWQAYHELGGIKGALDRHADRTYDELPSAEHRQMGRSMFLRLIRPGITEREDTIRRRVPLKELEQADPEQTRKMQETLRAFTDARLLTIDQIGGETTVEVSHEMLIQEWKRLAEWAHRSRDDVRFQQSLSEDVAEWEQRGKFRDRLYRGSQLKEAQAWARRNIPSSNEEVFLHASTQYRWQQWIRMIALLLVPAIVLGLIFTPLLVFRPSWCPSWLCPAPQVLLAKGGVHDSNLQVTLQALQSSIKVIPGDPSKDTLGNLPMTSDAQLIGTSQSLPYRVVLKIHSLQQGQYGLVIDEVKLVVNRQAEVIPYPLRVWIAYNVPTYNNNLYRVTYRGQGVKTVLTALYEAQQSGFVSLLPGETDELSLEIRSTAVVDLRFQVQVRYHVIGQLASHTLTLPNIFEVIFSDPANWHPYHLQNGHLVAAQ